MAKLIVKQAIFSKKTRAIHAMSPAVNPYDYVNTNAKAQMQALCDTYGEQCT